MASVSRLTTAALEAASSRPPGASVPPSGSSEAARLGGFPSVVPPPEGGGTGLVGFLETKPTNFPVPPKIPGVFSRSEFARLSRRKRLRRVSRAVMAKARAVRASCPDGFRWTGAFVTLTYRPGSSWQAAHIRRYMDAASAFARRRGVRLRYVWVAETQERGAVHYHLAVFWSSAHGRDFRLPKPDSCGWWPHGLSNIRRLRSAGESYLAKYISKGDDGALPKGLRLYGMDRHPADSLAVHRACLPDWLAVASKSGRVDRVPFFGWVARDSGERFRSWFRLVREQAGSSFVWRFVPAVERDPRCLDCLFSVMTGRLAGRVLSSGL